MKILGLWSWGLFWGKWKSFCSLDLFGSFDYGRQDKKEFSLPQIVRPR